MTWKVLEQGRISSRKQQQRDFLDIKNEPDHPNNIDGHNNWNKVPTQRDIIVSWLLRMMAHVRDIDRNHLVSTGIRWWQNFPEVYPDVDIALFHSYWDPAVELPFIINTMSQRKLPNCEPSGPDGHPNSSTIVTRIFLGC
jgi:hypothetical protein